MLTTGSNLGVDAEEINHRPNAAKADATTIVATTNARETWDMEDGLTKRSTAHQRATVDRSRVMSGKRSQLKRRTEAMAGLEESRHQIGGKT